MVEKEVSFKNKQGEKLVGYLHIPESRKYKHGIILAHCFTCSRHVKLMREMCDYLARDFLVLRFDFSGDGDSEGKFEDSTYSKEIEDYNSAVKFLLSYKVKSIGGLGHSMGSAVTLLAGCANPEIDAFVTMGGDSSTQGIERIFDKKVLDDIKKKGKCTFTIFGKKVTMTKEFFEDAKKYAISKTLSNSKKPLLVMHGEKDVIIPVSDARKLYFYASGPKDIKIMKGGDHMFKKSLDEALPLARNWFKKYLK